MAKAALVLLGANLPLGKGPPAETLAGAAVEIEASGAAILARSGLYRTPCFPPGAGPDFVNAAIAVDWRAGPADLLALLHGVEAAFGRTRGARWSARTLDLDLAAIGQAIEPDARTWRHWAGLDPATRMQVAPERLILPHPRLQDRGFALRPLIDIAPHWRHPILNRTAAELYAGLDSAETRAIVKISGPIWPN